MTSLEESRARLKGHFTGDSSKEGNRWEELWRKGDFLPWDRSEPNPALTDILTERQDLIGSPVDQSNNGESKRRRVLIPGCGRGYDVLLFASFGFDAYGLEISPSAIRDCLEEQKNNGSKYPAKDSSLGQGKVAFVEGDIFADDWLAQTDGSGDFDVIYDYTFLSAFPVSLRPAWALRMSQLLSKTGRLICIEFPTTKDPKLGGPPFALPPPVYLEHLSHPGEELDYDEETGHVVGHSEKPRGPLALLRIAHWQPARTHEVGKGADWVSIWQHQG